MTKIIRYIILSLLLLFSVHAYTQTNFSVSINLDASMQPEKFSCYYYDGKRTVLIPDTFTVRNIHLEGEYFSERLFFTCVYFHNQSMKANFFFIDSLPAQIHFTLADSVTYPDNPMLEYSFIKNMYPEYDTVNNLVTKDLSRNKSVYLDEINEIIRKRNAKNYDRKKDSLKADYLSVLKKINADEIKVLRKYPNSYYSFWYYQHNIVFRALNIFHVSDSYLQELKDTLLAIYPEKYLTSVEGKTLIKKIDNFLQPPAMVTVGVTAPDFSFTDYLGNRIDSKKIKEKKYILFDFWATWCGPCMAEIPFIQSLRAEYPKEKLEIIGISADRDSLKFANGIKENNMNWIHFLDKEELIYNMFTVQEIPTLILISPEGKVLFRSRENGGTHEQLEEILKKEILKF